jgi:glycosyltransferase involved in cell wall biosynthesis
VCFVLPSLNGGGAERAAVQVLNALDPAMWDRSMYLFDRTGPYLDVVDPAIRVASADGARVGPHAMGSTPTIKVARVGDGSHRLRRLTGLVRYLRQTRPRVVVSFLSYFSVLGAVRASRIDARVVFNQQTPLSAFLSDADYRWRRPWRRRTFSLVARIGYRLADAIVTTSRGVADDLVDRFEVARERITVVHNPVDLGAISAAAGEPLDADEERAWTRPAIVAAGRLADAKNYPLLLEAFSLLVRRYPARLVILGEGEREAALRDLALRLGLGASVSFRGFQRNPWKYIARADVFALSSRYEGFGNVLVEAMACGTPVVATTSPGTREIVTDGGDGVLVHRHDADAFAAALGRLLDDDDSRRRMAVEARRTAQRFALPAIANAYGRLFREVMA